VSLCNAQADLLISDRLKEVFPKPCWKNGDWPLILAWIISKTTGDYSAGHHFSQHQEKKKK